jgi:hypothetical protein
MISIDPRGTTLQRAICTFCSYGCELGIVSDDLGIRGVEYILEGVPNSGRLCPRGSAAAHYLNHPRRLTVPWKNGCSVAWDKIVKDLKKFIKKPDQVAVTFDRNLTREEYYGVLNFCRRNGIEACASSYLEPESLLAPMLQNEPKFNPTDIDASNVVVVIGDLFQSAPMTSKHIIEWRYRDRKNRLAVIDSLGTYTGKFATDFLKVGIGSEPLALLAMAGALDQSADPGLPVARLREIGDNLKNAAAGVILVTMPFGRYYDPILFIKALQTLTETSGKRIVPFVEYAAFPGSKRFGDVLEMARTRKIKQIINFGEVFPYHYPQFAPHLKNIELVATAVLKPQKSDPDYKLQNWEKITMLPAALNLEKTGTVETSFGPRPQPAGIPAASGALDVTQVLGRFGTVDVQAQSMRPADFSVAVAGRIENLKQKILNSKKGRYVLVGDKSAFNFMAFWEPERLRINPLEARQIGIGNGETVRIRTKNGEAEFPAELSDLVPTGVLAVPIETGRTKFLFDFEIEQGFVNFPPTEAELCRKE